jgi:hypothetical protein
MTNTKKHVVSGLKVSTTIYRNTAGEVTTASLSVFDPSAGNKGYATLIAWPDRPHIHPSAWLTVWGLYGNESDRSVSLEFMAELLGWAKAPVDAEGGAA